MIERAIAQLEAHGLQILERSRVFETQPWGVTDQPLFANAAVVATTSLTPAALLKLLKTIEKDLGRIERQRWGPRKIDIDLLLYGSEVVARPDLQVTITVQDSNLCRLCEAGLNITLLAKEPGIKVIRVCYPELPTTRDPQDVASTFHGIWNFNRWIARWGTHRWVRQLPENSLPAID